MLVHDSFMGRCLTLAERGRGMVGNGALVGAILVRDGQVIGEGWHSAFGRAHAEADLLKKFDQKSSSSDVLYVNLEPCCHQGKTPPCTDAIVRSGITTVVVGMLDPDHRASGKGIAALRDHGVTVIGPVLEQACRWLNRGFVQLRTAGRPWITLKSAVAPDGSVAHGDGSPRKITSQEQDTWSHTVLRARHDAILVGSTTIRTDNPLLDKRLSMNNEIDQKNPYKIVLDRICSISKQARILQHEPERTLVIVGTDAPRDRVSIVGNTGARVLRVECDDRGVFVWRKLWEALCTPRDAYTGLTSILVEGGPATWRIFRDAGMVDMEVLLAGGNTPYHPPRILRGG